ncbi:MAG: glycosyltransferase, partial [Bacteroidales bacterium]|nr:glycosyltransferase [Bacteroidales bacterium]
MHIIFCVTNDIVTDQRIHRITLSLSRRPAEILITGVSLPGSLPLPAMHYKPHRITVIFRKGSLFYACYNVRLFFYLLFKRADLLVANDLDTLPAVSLAAWLKRKPLVYDSHEYFTGLPELVNRPVTRKIWEFLEALLLPHVKYASTVSKSIAAEYRRRYGITMEVIRNLPKRILTVPERIDESPEGISTIIYQGALNMGRGLELVLMAMQYANNCRLV